MGKKFAAIPSMHQSAYYCSLEETAVALAEMEGADIPLSRERIRQLQSRAMVRFKAGMEAKGYTLEDVIEAFSPDNCRVE